MRIVIDEKNEWWICDVDRCPNEIEFGGNRPTGIAVTVCRHHSQPDDVSIRNQGIPLDEADGIWLNYDNREEEWWIGQWHDGTMLASDLNSFKTLAAALEAWNTGDYSLEKDE